MVNDLAKEKKCVFKGAIFDVDGVIVDTAHIHHKSWEIVFKKYGIKFTFKDFKSKIDGKPRAFGARTIMPDVSEEEISKICAEKQVQFERILNTGKIKVFKTTVDFIKMLRKKGYKLAMASSSRNAGPILKKVKVYNYFDAEVEGGMLERGKPHPDIFLIAAKKLKLKPCECIVFEDAQIGIDAAVNAGIKCAAINRDKSHKITGANIRVNDFRQLSLKKIQAIF
jgi:beta-phosphoglucomutase